MAFFDPQEALLAGGNRFFCIRKGELRIKPAGVICNELCRWILCNRKKRYFFDGKSCQAIFYLFFQ
jgi:hypothetical protein